MNAVFRTALFFLGLACLAWASVRRTVGVTNSLTIQVPGYSPTEDDGYIGVSIKAVPGYIVRFEPFAHADRVHHILLYGCDKPAYDSNFWEGGATCAGASHILYAWARNAPSLTLPDTVGFAIGNSGDPVQYIVLQVHYAHPFAGKVRDFSGVTMHLTNVRPLNLAAVYLFVSGEPIPPRQDIALNNVSCTYEGDVDLHPFAFRTHTHQIGRVVSAYFKEKGHWTQIGKRNPQWPQLFQKIDHPLTIKKGDFMAAICRFDSHERTDFTGMGSMGDSEMCNFYMMFYRDANATDPFPWGAGCSGNENPDLVSKEYPADGVATLAPHPEWEHVAHQMDKPFGVKRRIKQIKLGDQTLGQVAGLAFDARGDLFIFHRSSRLWNANTFDYNNKLQDETPISEDVIIRAEIGESTLNSKASYGKGLFYMPHGIFVDPDGFIYTTDVGSHQVIKWTIKSGSLEPVWQLGEKFVPGSDTKHFCKPSAVAVSKKDKLVYVTDGYCNNRVMVFDKDGRFIQQFGSASQSREGGKPPLGSFFLPHDIVLDDQGSRIFVADRENGRVQIFNQGGDPIQEISYPSLFRDVYAMDYSQEHGLFLIPGTNLDQKSQLEVFVCHEPSFKLQYAFRPADSDFQRPHILRVRDSLVVVGEIAESGGMISVFDVISQHHGQRVSSEELYRIPEAGDGGSLSVVILLVSASILIACFVAYMRYRDVSDSNAIDRTGFKPLATEDVLSEDSEDEAFARGKP